VVEAVKPFVPFPAKVAQEQVIQDTKQEIPVQAFLEDAATLPVKVPFPESKPEPVAVPVAVPIKDFIAPAVEEPKPEASAPEPVISKAPIQKEETPQRILVPVPQQVKIEDVPKVEITKAELAKPEVAKVEVTKFEEVKPEVVKVPEVTKPEVFKDEVAKEEVEKKVEVATDAKKEVKKEEVKKFEKPLGV